MNALLRSASRPRQRRDARFRQRGPSGVHVAGPDGPDGALTLGVVTERLCNANGTVAYGPARHRPPLDLFGRRYLPRRCRSAPRAAFPLGAVDFRILELLSARLCHELSGPIAAIDNGVELLVEEEAVSASSAERELSARCRAAGQRQRAPRQEPIGVLSLRLWVGRLAAERRAAALELARSFFEATRIACEYRRGHPGAARGLAEIGLQSPRRSGPTRCRAAAGLDLTRVPLSLEAVGEAPFCPRKRRRR